MTEFTTVPGSTVPDYQHRTVLLDEAVDALDLLGERVNGTYIDGTFGRGGHSRLILSRLGPQGRLVAFDKDPQAIATAEGVQDPRFTIVHDSFATMQDALAARGISQVDGILLDLGISSPQVDDATRGFSFRQDGPLDMRMAQAGMSAADFVNEADENEIADVLYQYGDEPKSRRVARAIVAARPLTRTGELAHIVRRALGYKAHDKKDPATRAFQAIRIHVNRELGELADGLLAAERVLRARFQCYRPGPLALLGLGLLTYALINITWVFFRAKGFEQAWTVLRGMFGGNPEARPILTTAHLAMVALIVGGIVIAHWLMRTRTLEAMLARRHPLQLSAALGVMAFAVVAAQGAGNAFIYFQF